jgi:hypothetical protein
MNRIMKMWFGYINNGISKNRKEFTLNDSLDLVFDICTLNEVSKKKLA